IWNSFRETGTDAAANKSYTTFMSQTDPYNHLRTTNQWQPFAYQNAGSTNIYNQIFSDSNMTLVNNHRYMKDCNDTLHNDTSLYYFSVFSGNDVENSQRFNKPNNDGEGGLTPCAAGNTGPSPNNDADTNGVIIKGYAWGAFM